MERNTLYRNVTTSVRTPRFAVFINKRDKYWSAYVEGAISVFSQTWGGEYFLLIPTDGETIEEKFWQILEAYSPDKLGVYLPTLLDLEDADPKEYEKIKQRHKDEWQLPDDQDFEKTWLEQAPLAHFNELTISEKLSQELKNRLSPFYFEDDIISENVRREDTLGFPFTKIANIVEFAKDKPTQISVPMKIKNKELQLMAIARTGVATPTYSGELCSKGLQALNIPENFSEEKYVQALEESANDFRLHKTSSKAYRDKEKYPDENYFRLMPFTLSMLKLSKYYRLDLHHKEEENVTVIVGNSIEDYCLYYCLSHLHQGVYWLPEGLLRKANKKVEDNANRPEDAEIEKYTPAEQLALSVVREYFKAIRYGNHKKRIDITSFSLDVIQLEECKKWMNNICLLSSAEIRNYIGVRSLDELSVTCILRAMEINNYANQQDMVFQNGQSVGRVNTPKPKNFTFIDPSKHLWITSLNISGYYPPVLPFLGSKIIQLPDTSYPTRVAIDGLAYLCPHIASFGEDIDNTTIRPKLRLLDATEIFTQYFDYSGFKIKLSDKGSYLKDTIERFGSLEDVASFFRNEENRNIFEQFLYEKNKKDIEVIYLDTEKRTYLSFEAFNQNLSSKDKTIELLDQLISKDILRRGLIFQCSRCRRAAWYDISDVSKDFKCKRCDLVQQVVYTSWKQPEEPRWYYSLVETVYLFYKSRSHLTALSLDKIRQSSKVAFHYICEADIIDFPKEGAKKEVDILAISDGKIVLGECKDCEPKASDLNKYIDLYSRLKIPPAQFVLATTEASISPDVSNKLIQIKNSKALLRTDLYS